MGKQEKQEICAYCSSRYAQEGSLKCKVCERVLSSGDVKLCDRCGKKIRREENNGVFTFTGQIEAHRPKTTIKRYVCRKCTPEIHQFMAWAFEME